MACNGCGHCCSYIALEVKPDTAKWIELHGVPVTEKNGVHKLIISKSCKWLDEESKRCTHYEERPEICRNYLCEKAKGDTLELTKEMIETRKAQLQADLHAISGAMQDCDYWLQTISQPEDGIPIEELIPDAVIEEVSEVE